MSGSIGSSTSRTVPARRGGWDTGFVCCQSPRRRSSDRQVLLCHCYQLMHMYLVTTHTAFSTLCCRPCQVITTACCLKAQFAHAFCDAICNSSLFLTILAIHIAKGLSIDSACRQQCQCCLLGQCVRSTECQKARCGRCADISSQAPCQNMG